MKKNVFHIAILLLALTAFHCSSPSRSTTSGKTEIITETIIPNTATKSFQKELAGTWNVLSMRRQAKAKQETLSGVSLTFNEQDNKFNGKAPCNSIFGTVQLNGYSIRFQEVGATRMACDKMEQETAYLELLQNRISSFSIEGSKLYLKDVASNIVLECERAK
ncbi:hypothetical protein PIECOFPK_00864 [Mycovorax composti]|jgi:Heat shock protein|uniref:DUF306 domain-containing protein n=1 Tax=Mycovorax composti TaxID=2962693 RepID=A0ABZ2EI17_9BACT